MNATNAKTETTKSVSLTSKVADLRKEAEAQKIKEAKKETAVKPVVKKEEGNKPVIIPLHTAESRIKHLENFNILAKRFQVLKEKHTELEKFKIANDGTRMKLTLSTDTESFKVNNSETLELVINLIQGDLKERINKTEKEVQDFVI